MIAGNGYIEGAELDGFLREFVSSVNVADVGPEVSLISSSFIVSPLCLVLASDDNEPVMMRPRRRRRRRQLSIDLFCATKREEKASRKMIL